MMMVALGLQAQREKPVPVGTTELQPSQDTGGQMYYLYSKAGDFFYTSGNNWGTQASQGTEGHQVYFRPYLDADQASSCLRLFTGEGRCGRRCFRRHKA